MVVKFARFDNWKIPGICSVIDIGFFTSSNGSGSAWLVFFGKGFKVSINEDNQIN